MIIFSYTFIQFGGSHCTFFPLEFLRSFFTRHNNFFPWNAQQFIAGCRCCSRPQVQLIIWLIQCWAEMAVFLTTQQHPATPSRIQIALALFILNFAVLFLWGSSACWSPLSTRPADASPYATNDGLSVQCTSFFASFLWRRTISCRKWMRLIDFWGTQSTSFHYLRDSFTLLFQYALFLPNYSGVFAYLLPNKLGDFLYKCVCVYAFCCNSDYQILTPMKCASNMNLSTYLYKHVCVNGV